MTWRRMSVGRVSSLDLRVVELLSRNEVKIYGGMLSEIVIKQIPKSTYVRGQVELA